MPVLSISHKLRLMQVDSLVGTKLCWVAEGESGHARQFLAVVYILYRRSERQ